MLCRLYTNGDGLLRTLEIYFNNSWQNNNVQWKLCSILLIQVMNYKKNKITKDKNKYLFFCLYWNHVLNIVKFCRYTYFWHFFGWLAANILCHIFISIDCSIRRHNKSYHGFWSWLHQIYLIYNKLDCIMDT